MATNHRETHRESASGLPRGVRFWVLGALVFGFSQLSGCSDEVLADQTRDESARPADSQPAPIAEARRILLDQQDGQASLGGGRWRTARHSLQPELDPELMAEMAELEAIGYVDGSEPGRDLVGVTVHDASRTQAGLNLVVSAHRPEAFLMDADGRELHRWQFELSDVWPERKRLLSGNKNQYFWRRAFVYPNGDLLAIYEGICLIKLDSDSNLLWAYDGLVHHDLELDAAGRIHVLTRQAKLIPRFDEKRPVLEDFIAVLDPEGHELELISLLECLEASEFTELLDGVEWGDLFHTNTCEILDGRLGGGEGPFAAGNYLVSMRELSAIAVVDPKQSKVVWALRGDWHRQHQPASLDNGNLLLFDNQGELGHSRVLELEPHSGEVVWSYRDETKDAFFSRTGGSCQALANGNILITESDFGRAFEITREGEIVWEFHNPYRAGEDDKLIATLFEVVRLDPNLPTGWTEEGLR